jgi:hypothetical protein
MDRIINKVPEHAGVSASRSLAAPADFSRYAEIY